MKLSSLLFFGIAVAGSVALYLINPVMVAEYQRVMVIKSSGAGSAREVDIRLKDGNVATLRANAFTPHSSGMACAQVGQAILSGTTKISLVDISQCPKPTVRKISRMTTTSPTGKKAVTPAKKNYKKFSAATWFR